MLQQLPSLFTALTCGQFQPVTGLLRFVVGLMQQLAKLQLRALITGPRRLTQQFQADTAVAGVATVTAEHAAQTALRRHLALQRWLLEQTPGKALDADCMPQARAVEQPEGDAGGKTFDRRRRGSWEARQCTRHKTRKG